MFASHGHFVLKVSSLFQLSSMAVLCIAASVEEL